MVPSPHKHWRIFLVRLTEVFHFRLRALMWFMVGAVNTVILLLFWWATLSASGQTTSGLTVPAITTYYLLMTSLATMTICHPEEDIAHRDIYKGTLYRYLLQPYPYLLAKFQEEIVWRLLGGFWALATLILVQLGGFSFTVSTSPLIWLLTLGSAGLGILVSFFWKSIIGLLAIWFTNIRGVMELDSVLQIVLAGFVLPLHFLPQPLQQIALLSPWAAPVYYPIAILTQSLDARTIASYFGLQLFWLSVFGLTAQWTLHKGLRAYTGVSQ